MEEGRGGRREGGRGELVCMYCSFHLGPNTLPIPIIRLNNKVDRIQEYHLNGGREGGREGGRDG